MNNFENLLESFEKELNFKVDSESKANTPNRLHKMYTKELLSGYSQKPEDILLKRFKALSDDMIIVQNIPFVSLCSHHWLPFIGKVHIGYIPNKEITGLSKLPRLVQCYARRFQIQENMTSEIADSLYKILKPKGCIVICEAEHLCAQIRGIQALGTVMKTSAIRGCFKKKEIRNEFLQLIKG